MGCSFQGGLLCVPSPFRGRGVGGRVCKPLTPCPSPPEGRGEKLFPHNLIGTPRRGCENPVFFRPFGAAMVIIALGNAQDHAAGRFFRGFCAPVTCFAAVTVARFSAAASRFSE